MSKCRVPQRIEAVEKQSVHSERTSKNCATERRRAARNGGSCLVALASLVFSIIVLPGCSYWNSRGMSTTSLLQDPSFLFASLTDDHCETTRGEDGTLHSRSVVEKDLLHVGILFLHGGKSGVFDASSDEVRVLVVRFLVSPVTYGVAVLVDESTKEIRVAVHRSAVSGGAVIAQPEVRFDLSKGNLLAFRRNPDNTLSVDQIRAFVGTRPRDPELDGVDARLRRLVRGFEPILREIAESPDAVSSSIAAKALRRHCGTE